MTNEMELLESEQVSEEESVNATFDTLPLRPEIIRAVEELGFAAMTPIQEQAIPVLMEGKDVIGQAQTGTGKTAAFGLPLLNKIDPEDKSLQAVVLCPTRELAMQASEDLHDFSKYMHNVRILPVYGGQDMLRQIKGLKNCQVVVGTPGRVMDHMRRHTMKMDHVKTVVLDEADEMLDMGFREDMEVILGEIQGEHQTCLFSATMPDPILELTKKFQTDPTMIRVTPVELTIDTIKQYYYPVYSEYKKQATLRLLTCYRYSRCIIFCNTKSMVDELSSYLQREGLAAEGLHGDLTQNQRDSVMGRFRGGNLKILIATDIAARGIDVDRVEAVINYDIPQETEYYVHRIGRTGRAGNEGVSHTLTRSSEFRKLHEIERICHTTMEERKIPEPSEILESRKDAALEQVMEILAEGKSGRYVPVIQKYCEENNLTPEVLCAAFLKREIGDEIDHLPINLPERKERSEHGRGRRRSERGEFGEGRRRGDRGDFGEGRRRRGDRGDFGEGRRRRGDRGDFGEGRRRRGDRGDFGEERRRRDDRDNFGEEQRRRDDRGDFGEARRRRENRDDFREERRRRHEHGTFGEDRKKEERIEFAEVRKRHGKSKDLNKNYTDRGDHRLKKQKKDVRQDGRAYRKSR